MTSPPPTLPSHLALLARLELLHQSGILSSSSSFDAPSYLAEHDAEPLHKVKGGWEGNGGGNEAWREVTQMLRLLGDGLRDERLRIPLGQTSLPLALSEILRLAIEKPPFTLSRASTATSIQTVTYENPGLPESSNPCPVGDVADAIVEICRVAGNMCFDCDGNRSILLANQLPQSLLGLVSMLHESPRPVQEHYPLVKSALGALLNISLEHDGVQTLIAWSDNSVEAVLSLACQLYIPLESSGGESSTGPGAEERATVALWAWKTIYEVSQLDPAPTFDPQSVLPSLLRTIKAFLSSSSPSRLPSSPLLAQDLQIVSLSTSTLASQTIASEPFQLSLFNTPFFLSSILRFIEVVDLPPTPEPAPPQRNEGSLSSDDETDDEDEDHSKTLSMVKGTLVSVVVAVFGEDEVGELVLGSGEGEGKELRDVLERWVGLAITDTGDEGREDLGICAVLSLGNLARNESHCIALLAPPSPLLERVLPLLSPKTDLKLQHGLVGLLKNLSIPEVNKAILGSAGVAELVVGMGCLASERDNVGSVQGGAVGILKFLAKGSVSNALRIVLPSASSAPSSAAPLDALLTFQARTADPALKMEAGRTLVNLARTLFSTTAEEDSRLEEGRRALSGNSAVVDGLVALVRSGSAGGYMGIVGEGVMGLAVVASSSVEAASSVAASLVRLLPVPTGGPTPPSGDAPSEVPTLATLTSLLSLGTTANALKVNILALLGAAGRAAGSSAEVGEFEDAIGAGAGEGEDDGLQHAREVARAMLKGAGVGVQEQ